MSRYRCILSLLEEFECGEDLVEGCLKVCILKINRTNSENVVIFNDICRINCFVLF